MFFDNLAWSTNELRTFNNTATYDDGGRVTSLSRNGVAYSLTYDSYGNLKSRSSDTEKFEYSYDSLDRLTSVSRSQRDDNVSPWTAAQEQVSYTYSGWMRTTATRGGVVSSFGYDGYNCVSETTGSQVTTFVHAMGNPLWQTGAGVTTTYLKDGRGSVIGSVSGGSVVNERQYSAFGQTTQQVGGFGYRGLQTNSDTGLIYMRHRYYDPVQRQFITEDPAQAGLNWYRYAGNDPVNAWDPMGLDYIHTNNETDEVFWVSAGGSSSWWNHKNLGSENAGDRMAKIGTQFKRGGYWYVKLYNGETMPLAVLTKHAYHAVNSDGLGDTEFRDFVHRQVGNANSPYNNTQQYAAGLFKTADKYAVPVAKAVATLPVLYLGGVAFGDKIVAGGKAVYGAGSTAISTTSAAAGTASVAATRYAQNIYSQASAFINGFKTQGVRIYQHGNYWIKSVDQTASKIWQWWGRGTLNAQANALQRLGDMAPSFIYRNGNLVTRDIGKFSGGFVQRLQIWIKGSWRMKTIFNDIAARNIGANGQIFDPAKHWIQRTLEASAVGLGGATAYQKIFSTSNDEDEEKE